METCNSDAKVAFSHAKSADEGWDPWRLVNMMLSTLF